MLSQTFSCVKALVYSTQGIHCARGVTANYGNNSNSGVSPAIRREYRQMITHYK